MRRATLAVAAFLTVAGLPPVPATAAPAAPTFTVRNVRDFGPDSLRLAIIRANAGGTVTDPALRPRIVFDIPGSGTHVIQPASNLPALAVPTVVDGYSQPGAAPATASTQPVLLIVIDARNATRGLELTTGSAVSGLVIRSAAASLTGATCSGDGICVTGSRNLISGNVIGMGADARVAFPNAGDGIDIQDDDNVVGGPGPGGRNVISANGGDGVRVTGDHNHVQNNLIGVNGIGVGDQGNGQTGVDVVGHHNTVGVAGAGNVISNNVDGVKLTGDDNTVRGNFIGTDVAGATKLANSRDGIEVQGTGNVIGGGGDHEGNLVSGNDTGVFVEDESSGTLVQGNKIGTAASGRTEIGNILNGVTVHGDDTTIGGTGPGEGNLISGNGGDGVEITDVSGATATGNRVEGNLIGTTLDGELPLDKTGDTGNGVTVTTAVFGTTQIGGTDPGARNVISGNGGFGIDLFLASGTVIKGNFIGTDDDGLTGVPNMGGGINVEADNTAIGGADAGAGNTISANVGNGVTIEGTGNVLAGNAIGTDAAGTQRIGNTGHGVEISGVDDGNLIGSDDVFTPANTIAYNGQAGVAVTADTSTNNRILRNAVFGNIGNGGYVDIDLGDPGDEGIDAGDADTGANNLQNYPEIFTVTTTDVTGRLDSLPAGTFRIEFFASDGCRTAGTAQSYMTYLGTTDMTIVSGSTVDINMPLPTAMTAGQYLTMTATAIPAATLIGPTSELSVCVQV